MNAANILYQNVAAGRGAKAAVFCRNKAWTYQELVHLASSAGNGLRSLGIERENRVALLLPDGPELLAAFYGALAIGAIPTLLNTALLSADYEFLLNQSGRKSLLSAQISCISSNRFYRIVPTSVILYGWGTDPRVLERSPGTAG
jgi:acyl-CoA synthetase (AMP-forming)/AMP-acid ligase II